MNKNSFLFLFALVAIASASTAVIEPTSQAFTFNFFAGWSASELYVAAIGLIVLGLVNLLFGLKYSKIIIFLLGFIISAASAFAIETASSVNSSGQMSVTLNVYLIALVSGVIGGCVFYFCYHCSIFTIGFVLGCALVFGGLAFIGFANTTSGAGLIGILTLAGGIAGGIIALKVNDLVLIVSTSFAGAAYITWAICIFVANTNFMYVYQNNRTYSLINLGLAICGIIYQLKNKSINQDDLQRGSVTAPDVYVIDMNHGTEAYNPYTGRKF